MQSGGHDVPATRIIPPSVPRLTGAERFIGADASVVDFWRFALSDLRMNNARGYLAEFLVARALGIDEPVRIEWADYDVVFEGITIEVKASAYLQAWEQRQLSQIRFTGLKSGSDNLPNSPDRNGKHYNAQVYVFGVQTATTHDVLDPLDVTQWDWYVLARPELAKLNQAAISLAGVRALATAVPVSGLVSTVRAAAERTAAEEAGGEQV